MFNCNGKVSYNAAMESWASDIQGRRGEAPQGKTRMLGNAMFSSAQDWEMLSRSLPFDCHICLNIFIQFIQFNQICIPSCILNDRFH